MRRPLIALLVALCGALLFGGALPHPVRADAPTRLPGHTLPALSSASRLTPPATPHGAAAVRAARPEAGQTVTLTIVLNRTDEASFQRYLAGAQASHGPYLSQQQLADRFGPGQAAYDAVLGWLQGQGFALTQGSSNRLTLTVSGTRAQAEDAFGVKINDYQAHGKRFYANDDDPEVPANIARDIRSVSGLSNLAQPHAPQPSDTTIAGAGIKKSCLNKIFVGALPGGNVSLNDNDWVAYVASFAKGPLAILGASDSFGICVAALQLMAVACYATTFDATLASCNFGSDPPFVARGAGQKVGLLEFDTFNPSDVSNWVQFVNTNLPGTVAPNAASQVTKVPVNGGVATPGAGEPEVLLDIDAILGIATGANVSVYSAPGSTSFQQMFQAMINDGDTVISNSWGYCEDETSLADAQGIDTILAQAAAAGISVVNGAGDGGSTCLDGSPNTVGVPSDSPSATAVGGTSATPGTGGMYGSETWWDGSASSPPTGQGGFGVSTFFSRPAYQNGLTSSAMRSVPDVAANADPAAGFTLCQADAGGCPDGQLHGGTSLAAPEWAAVAAILNQDKGSNLGALNPRLYPLAGSGAFHTAASMASDFAHVGLGSPDISALSLAIRGATAGPVSASVSTVTALSNVAPADGTPEAALLVNLRDANGNPLGNKTVTISQSASGHAVIAPSGGQATAANGVVAFTVADATIESVTFTATDTTDGTPLTQTAQIAFLSPVAVAGGISAAPTVVPNDGTTVSTVTVTLQDGQGHGSPGKVVSLTKSLPTPAITGPSPATTDANGQTTFHVTDTSQETVSFTATDVTDGSLPIPGSATVTFGPSDACNRATPLAAAGYTVTDYATGFPLDTYNYGCVGPIGLAFDTAGNLFVSDPPVSTLYRFAPGGGAASAATKVATVDPSANGNLAGLAFGKDGKLYGTQQGQFEGGNGRIIELDPVTGAVKRVVAAQPGFGLTDCASGIATDPLSGDLFTSQPRCSFLGGEQGVSRVSNPASATPTISHYGATGIADGVTVGPDGTIYTVVNSVVIQTLPGTNSPGTPPFTPTTLVNDPTLVKPDGIAVSADPAKKILYVNRNDGTLTKVDFSGATPVLTPVFTGGSRGDFVTVGPDGCIYATQTDRIVKVTKSDGSCDLAVTNPGPAITLSPNAVSPNPTTSAQQTFTATFNNVTVPAGTPVQFNVSGANATATGQATTDASGKATFTYTGARVGTDSVTATATVNSTTVRSNAATVTWVAGKDVTFLTLNGSAKSGAPNQTVTLQATLTDLTQNPPAPIANASIAITLQGNTCTATTNANGVGSCNLAVSGPANGYPLSASYAGNTSGAPQYAASKASVTFLVTQLAHTAISTALTAGNQTGAALSVPAGTSVSDTATLGGVSGTAAGTVTYTVYTDSGCTAALASSASTVTVSNGLVPASTAVSFATAGTFSWQAVYSGDGANAGATSACGSEVLTVTLAATSLSYTGPSTATNGAGLTVSAALTDSASHGIAGVTLTFTLGSGGSAQTCSGTTNGSGAASCTIASVNQTLGPVPLSVVFAGSAGYSASSTSASITVSAGDTTPPTTTATATSNGQPYSFGATATTPVQVTLSASDNAGGSGVATTYYGVDTPTCTPTAPTACTVYSAPFTISATGAHTLTYFSVDKAGNVETPHSASIVIQQSAAGAAEGRIVFDRTALDFVVTVAGGNGVPLKPATVKTLTLEQAQQLLGDGAPGADERFGDGGVWELRTYTLSANGHSTSLKLLVHRDLAARNVLLWALSVQYDRGKVQRLPANFTDVGWQSDRGGALDEVDQDVLIAADDHPDQRQQAHSTWDAEDNRTTITRRSPEPEQTIVKRGYAPPTLQTDDGDLTAVY